ncbi:MAG: mechanosensitive ion channel [Tyzzerella sp.]|uniref:Mechanosensitive ion channel n=1 Tax=Candidatus Fimicola merdigallinarum TaxID=2840819 RepID=A0A9D9DWI0_9FIRM|nr:mechanosensitive ion channel [Candidatus Fimicola merdigallinarum]
MPTESIQTAINTGLKGFTIEKLGSAILVFIVCYIVAKILIKVISKVVNKLPFDRTLTGFINATIKLLIYFVIAIMVSDALGIDPTSLIAILSVVGLAVSLAVQGSLSNVANGLVILVAKPFSVGDFVEIDGVSGTVQEISLNYTKIVTADNKVVYIPNSDISDGKIVNYTAESVRRVDITVTAAYETPVENVRKALKEAVLDIPEFHKEPSPIVYTVNYGESSIAYSVRAWTDTENYWNSYYALMENIAVKFEKYDVEMTYNHIKVHMVDDK